MIKFYKCKHCKNIAVKVQDSKVPLVCCGEKMEELIPMQSDGALEKHLPVATFDETSVKVSVGEVLHPMTDEHYISFVVLELKDGYLLKYLSPSMQPIVTFDVKKEDVVSIYEYCTIHGLYKVDVK